MRAPMRFELRAPHSRARPRPGSPRRARAAARPMEMRSYDPERLLHEDARVERDVVRHDELDCNDMEAWSQTGRVVLDARVKGLHIAIDTHVDMAGVWCDVLRRLRHD